MFESFPHPRIRPRQIRCVSLVKAQEPPCQCRQILGSIPASGRLHSSLNEFGRAVADHRRDLFERKRASCFLREQLVDGDLDVRGAVDQRAVQIKDHCFDCPHDNKLALASEFHQAGAACQAPRALAEVCQLFLFFPAARRTPSPTLSSCMPFGRRPPRMAAWNVWCQQR